MRVVVFGATGMIGQGVALECLRDAEVTEVVTVSRMPVSGVNPRLSDARLREILHDNFLDFSVVESGLGNLDACFYCLGVSSAGMNEADYTRITYDFTMAAAETLSRLNPGMIFIFVSGASTDSTEQGKTMWARVKGRAENALLRLPLKAYMFRPGAIEARDGIQSRTPVYRIVYSVAWPLLRLLHWMLPQYILSTREIGQAMLAVARRGYAKPILETQDIRAVLRG